MGTPSTEVMQCMEVWGGNQPVDSVVSLSGLDAWVYSQPFGHASGGGDVYYVSSCATGRITRLLVADVSGHGVVVGELAVSLRDLMRRYVNFLDQTRFVAAMNRQFTELAEAGKFATAVVITYFATSRHLSLCNAGHPPPLVYRAATRQWNFLRRNRPDGVIDNDLPLGIQDVFDYTEFEVRLGHGDIVLCFTDSLIEARLPDGGLLGAEGLLNVLRKLSVNEPAQMIPDLLKALQLRTGSDGLANDDVTILLFRPRKRPRLQSIRIWLGAPFRIVGGVMTSMRPGGGPVPWFDISLPNVGGAIFAPLGKLWRGRARKDPSPLT